ncbi:MAG: hypothetical protein HEQ27_05380 [Dolichospermum sp. JUN01]|nr:hypothetical protein [Dolichospermum sp. JUN01]
MRRESCVFVSGRIILPFWQPYASNQPRQLYASNYTGNLGWRCSESLIHSQESKALPVESFWHMNLAELLVWREVRQLCVE